MFSRLLGIEVRRNLLNSTRLIQSKLAVSIFGYSIFFQSIIYPGYQDILNGNGVHKYCMMDRVAPTCIVVEHDVDRDEVFNNDNESPSGSRSQSPTSPPPVFRARSRRSSFHWTVESPSTATTTRASPVSSEQEHSLPQSTAFAKLVRTVQFIKKWSKRAEREPDSAREEFLDRFKMNGPGADSAFGRSTGVSDKEVDFEEGRRDCCYLWRIIKRRRHLLLIWNPSGHWLYR